MEPTWELLRIDPSGQRVFRAEIEGENFKAWECLQTVETDDEPGYRIAPADEVPPHYIVRLHVWLNGFNRHDKFEADLTEIVLGAEKLDEAAKALVARLGFYVTALENADTDPIRRLRLLQEAVREHMNETGHGRCWMDDKRLYANLPEGCQADFQLPPKPEWDKNCREHCDAYWHQRQPLELRDYGDPSLRMVQDGNGGDGTPGGS